MPHILGAYATSPCQTAWDPAAEAAFYDGLTAIPGVDGFELPFTGALHPFDEAWLLRHLPAGWRHVVTCLPGTMQRLAGNPHFGLASDDAAGRASAVAFAGEARDAVARLNRRLGPGSVLAVELHSAPSRAAAGVRSSAASLAASLAELAVLDWDGADLVIEHCDAFTPAHPAHKGFLSLDDELAAIELTEADAAARSGGAALGMSVNWARSVLETRDPATGCAHVARIAAAGRLSGIVFSGCGSDPDQPYGAWQDNHMPAGEGSLLTAAAIRATLAAGRPGFIGVKVGARPADLSVARRIALNADLMALVTN